MAEVIASPVVEFCVEKMLSRAFREIAFAKDVNSHVQSLYNTKITIEALLLDVDKMQSVSQAERMFLDRLSCAVDKVDDLLDVKAARAKLRQVMGGRSRVEKEVLSFFYAFPNLFISLFRDAKKVMAIRKELNSIARDHAQFGSTLRMLTSTVGQTSLASKAETGSYIVKEEVVGRDRDKDKIISMLFGSSRNGVRDPLSVISIVGIGGIGKSTLAKYVYNDEKVQMYFDLQFWVCATQDFNIKEMLQKIVASATGEKAVHYEMDQLEDSLIKKISGKKYLLVLDNVWDNHNLSFDWGELWNVLMSGAPGSRILITTRTESVARKVCMHGDLYLLMDLAAKDSWLLFQRVAFRPWQEPGVEAIGKEIAKMCRNVPIVIRTIGGFLAEKCTVKEWQAFRDDEFANLNLYGPKIMQTLKLSYDQLEPSLKLCFAYCSLFPKGYRVVKHKLIHVLVSLDYVEKQYKNQSLVDAGEACVLSLLKRGLFHDLRMDVLNTTESFTMHDLIHDLAISIAGCKFKMVGSKSDELDTRLRHVSFSKEAEICLESLSQIQHLRSLLVIGTRSTHPKLTGLSRFFPYLRVLSFQGLKMKEVPRGIGKLIHLRYLDLSENDFCELPKSIKLLVYLLSLDLSRCSNLKRLPGEIGKLSSLLSLDLIGCKSLEKLPQEMSMLTNLRHLRLYECWGLRQMPIGLGNLTDLQTLDLFVAEHRSPNNVGVGLSELYALNNLEGELKILLRGRHCESREANLQMKEKLMALNLNFYSLEESHEEVLEGLQPHANLRRLTIWDYDGESLPKWMVNNQLHFSLPNLVEIQIYVAHYCTNLCSFGRLPHLKVLWLDNLGSVEYIEQDTAFENGEAISEVGVASFPSLESLTLKYMRKLKGWQRMSTNSQHTNESAHLPTFPRLKHLEVCGVGFKVVPDEFRGLSSLQTFDVAFCEQLKEIPEWIDGFTSLRSLSITDCPKLTVLPKQISNMTNLEKIQIDRCPGAFAEWWEDPTLVHCPIKHVAPQMEWQWQWQYSSCEEFYCRKYRKA